MLAITSPTTILGRSTITSLLSQTLIPTWELLLLTTSSPTSPTLSPFRELGLQIREISFRNPTPELFKGITKLLMISEPETKVTYNIRFLRCAVEAGVKHLFHTSFPFGSLLKSGIMSSHLRTEEFLAGLSYLSGEGEGKVYVTVIRESLVSESWTLYLGEFAPGLGKDERDEVLIPGDGKVCWTSIEDLGLAIALVLSKPEQFKKKTVYLSSGPEEAKSLKEIAGLVGQARGRELAVRIVSREEYVRYYVEERGGKREIIESWSSIYESLRDGECLIDDMTLRDLLKERGVEVTRIEETISRMME